MQIIDNRYDNLLIFCTQLVAPFLRSHSPFHSILYLYTFVLIYLLSIAPSYRCGLQQLTDCIYMFAILFIHVYKAHLKSKDVATNLQI